MEIMEPRSDGGRAQVDLDREILLKHSRHPSHAGQPNEFTHQGSCKNPLCGDAVDVGVEVDNGRISKIQIQVSGCGISTASASLMAEVVDGQLVAEALRKLEIFNTALTSAVTENWPEELAKLRPFARLRTSPTRVPCALIGWFALKDALPKT